VFEWVDSVNETLVCQGFIHTFLSGEVEIILYEMSKSLLVDDLVFLFITIGEYIFAICFCEYF
jgi:hypothetical protein